MPRDESRDVLIICDENGAPSNEYAGFWYHRTLTAKSLPIAQKDSLERFSPHSQLVDLERQLAEAKSDRDHWRKKHKEDNEGLMFQLGRNLEFAQEVAFRHGATEPHPTIKCIQIIDEHAASLESQLAERGATVDAQRSMLAGSVDSAFGLQPVMSHEDLCLTVERETSSRTREYASELTRLQGQLAERDDAIRKLQEALNELRRENTRLTNAIREELGCIDE